MKSFTTKSGQEFEIFSSLKEVHNDIRNAFYGCDTSEERMGAMTDCCLWIEYQDGSHYYLSDCEEEGKYKKTGIKTCIFSSPCTIAAYGAYKIINIDDIDEQYSEETDDESKIWNVEVA